MPSRDQHDQRRQRHGQHDILGGFSQLASWIRPEFNQQVMALIPDFEQQRGTPGEWAGDASFEDVRGEQENRETDYYMQRVETDAGSMFDDQLELIPAKKRHGRAHMRRREDHQGLCPQAGSPRPVAGRSAPCFLQPDPPRRREG